MEEIEQIIQQILDQRLGRGAYVGKGRLQQIQVAIDNLQAVKEKVYALDALIATIQTQLVEGSGKYYEMLSADPEAKLQFEDLKDQYNEKGRLNALVALDRALEKLELLKKRFGREAIRIAFIGRERQGKSTFIKEITGLTDKVIPAYSGNSCTGAVSVIHNVESVKDDYGVEREVKVEVEYFSVREFIDIVNDKLQRFFPNGSYQIDRLEQIPLLQLPEKIDGSTKVVTEYKKFREAFIDHYNDYSGLVGTGVQTYYEEDVIAYHVAQYEEFDQPRTVSYPVFRNGRRETEDRQTEPVEKNDGRTVHKVDYYKYVTVKNVDIYTRFEVPTTKRLELVDTIGIGGAADTDAVKKEMFRVLREDCDGAINLYRPGQTADWPAEQPELIDEIVRELKDRYPDKWIVYILNKITSELNCNVRSANGLLASIKPTLENEANKKIAWVKTVDGCNFTEVRDELMTPLLQLIAGNLQLLDDTLTEDASKVCKQAYDECLSLVMAAGKVTSASTGKNSDLKRTYDEYYMKMLNAFREGLNQIDDRGYRLSRDKECPELMEAYEEIIGQIGMHIPEEETIFQKFMKGDMEAPNVIFQNVIEQVRNDIFNDFDKSNVDVLHSLQEKVKTDVISVLYHQGLMSRLPAEHTGPTTEWLEEIISKYVDEKTYPALNNALRFILDYQIHLEGHVDYKATVSLSIIERTSPRFIPYTGINSGTYEELADAVWQELRNRIIPLGDAIRSWIGDFTLEPSHSFYSFVHKFHIKVRTDNAGVKDFEDFYSDNRGLIWSEELAKAAQGQKTFSEISSRVNDLQQVTKSENFRI